MFRVGDIVIDGSCNPDEFPVCVVCTDTDRTIGEESTAVIDIRAGTKGHALTKGLTTYTGPIYEEDGKRFVISGEVRPPQNGEWYTHDVSGASITQAECAPYDNSDCVIILLPVPEVEPADPFLDGTRAITDEDLHNCLTLENIPVVRCRADCCKKSSFTGYVEGQLNPHIANAGHIAYLHKGNSSSFAKMYSSDNSWKVEWLIPKKDIRVVEEAS